MLENRPEDRGVTLKKLGQSSRRGKTDNIKKDE